MTAFNKISYSDTGALDAFSRLRVSQPETIFAALQAYDSEPLLLESGATGTGVAPSYSANTRMTTLSCTAGTGTSFVQSYQYHPYQPGRSQFIAETFVLGTGVANTTVDVGYFDAANGVIFRQNGDTNLQFILRTSTSGSVSDANIVAQSSWNLDKMDGAGVSGVNLDVTKDTILIIDLQFLSMGRVRVGFNVNGNIYYAHQFLNANNLTLPYMQTATLPIGMLITANSSGSTKSANFKCSTVQSEGGNLLDFGFHFATPETTATAGNGSRVPIVAIRPKTTFNGITNRSFFVIESINLDVIGANDVFWELVLGGAYSGQTYTDVNTTYSAFEYTSAPGTFTNLTGGIVIASGYCSGGGSGLPQIIPLSLNNAIFYPITLDRAGAVRALGTMTLLVTGIGGASASRASIVFREIR